MSDTGNATIFVLSMSGDELDPEEYVIMSPIISDECSHA